MEKTAENGISRRSFLTGAAGVGALAAAGLAGCSPQESSSSDSEDASAEGADSTTSDWLGEAPEIADSDIVETRETDILIVGAGMSGMAAAATAADLESNFIVVDKSTEPAAAHYDVGAINSTYTYEADEEVDEGRLLNELNRYASFKNDSSVANTWIQNSAELIEWLENLYTEQGINVDVQLDVENGGDGRAGGTMYYMPAECHHFYDADSGDRIEHIEVLTSYVEAAGSPVQYGFDLVKLNREEGGRVTGAIFNTDNGYVQINAAKGVILACGGYAANPEMVKDRAPILTKCVTSLNYNQNNTGMGMKSALWVGAAVDDEPAYMIFDRGIVPPGTDAGYTDEEQGLWATGGQFNLGSQPFLKVDRKGKRITNESANYDAICLAAAKHPGGVWCLVMDSNAPDDVQRFKTQGCSAMTWQQTLNGTTVDEAYEEQIDEGLMMRADTLDELADQLGFVDEDKEQFLATIEQYNEMYDAGEDTQFGKESYRLSAIREAPFYGAWFGGALLTTLDGVRINENTQVLDTEGEVIEGLHAVGTCSGSYYAGNYPVYIVGNCLGRQMTFGRYAVRYLEGEIS